MGEGGKEATKAETVYGNDHGCHWGEMREYISGESLSGVKARRQRSGLRGGDPLLQGNQHFVRKRKSNVQ